MNERNVAAMRAAIERALERNCGHIDFCTGDFDGFVRDVAEEALVPSALTDAQPGVCPGCQVEFERGETVADVIHRLERIAKGEP